MCGGGGVGDGGGGIGPGIEVVKLEFILRLKIKRNDWLLADTSETGLKVYNLEAWF